MGATDSSPQFLRAEKKRHVTSAEEGFEGEAGAEQRHGWGGRVGRDMGNTCVQWGLRGWLVTCRGRSKVKVAQKEETTKWMATKKKIFPAKMSGEKKIEKFASKVPGRIDPSPQPRKL